MRPSENHQRKSHTDLTVQVWTKSFCFSIQCLDKRPVLSPTMSPWVSLRPVCWTQSVEAARRHLDSSRDAGFLLRLLRCHGEMAAALTEWHSCHTNQPQKHFAHLTGAKQVVTIKLPCHLLFSISSLLSLIHPLLFPLSFLNTELLFPHFSISGTEIALSEKKSPNGCKWHIHSGKWKGWTEIGK